jgi:glycosyltransferase involved in cell wall biosynthesis
VKVLHVIPSVSPLRGGPSSAIRMMVAGLASEGVTVDVATTDDDGVGRLKEFTEQTVTRSGLTYRYFSRQIGFYTFSWPLSIWLAQRVTDYDLVHIHALFSWPATISAFWAHRKAVPYIIRPLGVLNSWGVQNRRPFLKILSLRVIEHRILANAVAIHFTSEQEKSEAERLVRGLRSIVIPNPVAAPMSTTPSRPGLFVSHYPQLIGRKVILFLARIDPIKGLDLLLDGFASVLPFLPDAALVIAGIGEPDFVVELKRRAERLGIGRAVAWIGFTDGAMKSAAFAESDVFVLPSYSESFGIAAVEAMANGLPVIVTDQVAIHHDVARMNAGIVTKCDASSLAAAMIRVLQNPLIRARMSEGARRLAAEFSPSAVAVQLLNAYHGIVGSKPPRLAEHAP